MVKDKMMAFIDSSRLTEMVQYLVRIPSVNPPGNEKPVADYLL